MFTLLPIYLKIEIAIWCDHNTFASLVQSYDDMLHLWAGKMSKRRMKRLGNLSEYMFRRRCELWFPSYLSFRNVENIDWLCFYRRITIYNPNHYAKYYNNGQESLLEYTMLLANPEYSDRNYDYQVNRALLHEHYAALELFYREKKILPDVSNMATFRMVHWNERMLKWLESKNVIPGTNVANEIASHKDVSLLLWLKKQGVHPTIDGFYGAVGNEKLNNLKWMIKHIGVNDEDLQLLINYANQWSRDHIYTYLRELKEKREKG